MKVIFGSEKLKRHPKYPVLTMGNFDGMHAGHRKIIDEVVGVAKENGGTSILYTFDPHPVKILAPELAPPLLQTMEQKIAVLSSSGLDILMIEKFSKRFASLSPDAFFERIVQKRIGAREIVVGYDFTFGVHRSGKADDLIRLAGRNKTNVRIVDAIMQEETLLSSTHIRHFIERGDLRGANKMLGRPYSIAGKVVKGRGRGGELGFRTANLASKNELIPAPGVYVTTTIIPGKKRFKSVTNIGFSPTFQGSDLNIETFLMDFKGTLLGKEIEIEFHKKLRREMTFESADDLRRQIETDVSQAGRYHEKRIQE